MNDTEKPNNHDDIIEFAFLVKAWHEDILKQIDLLCNSENIPSIHIQKPNGEDALVVDNPEQIKYIQAGAKVVRHLIAELPFSLTEKPV